MPVEPWQGYLPEVNAGRYEAGTGSATWTVSAEMWTAFAAMVVETMSVFTAQMAIMGVNWMGEAPTTMAASASEFMDWLAEMEIIAVANAGACTAVAVAYAAGEGSMIPLPAVNANRISESVAEATNFMGVNTGTILMLNTEYAQFWGANGTTMMTYDSAVSAATVPKPVRPPPPLASLAAATSGLEQTTAEAAAKDGIGAASQGGMQAFSAATQAGTQAGSAAADGPEGMSSMLGSAGQFMSMPTQMLGQVGSLGSSLSSPAQSLMSPLQSLMSSMGGGLNGGDASALGISGPADGAFGGVSLAGSESAAGGGMAPIGGFGGGIGGSMMPSSSFMGASGPTPRAQPVFSGVTAKASDLSVAPGGGGSNGGLYGGGGMSPHAGGGAQSTSSGKPARIQAFQPTTAVLTGEEREADELFGDR